MKSKCAVWIAAILFAAAASVLAQDNQNQNQSATPPPAPQTSLVPEASPVPPAPAQPGNPPPADNPALPQAQASPALPQTAPSVAPAPSASAGTAPVDTIEKKASRRAESPSRKSAKKSVEPAPAPQAESKDNDKEKAAAAGAASIDTNGSGNGNAPGSSPPSGTGDIGAAPPPPAPVVENSALEETRSSKTEIRERGMGAGSWVLIAILFLGVIGAVALAIGNDHRDERISIHVEPDLGSHPKSPLAHTRLS